MKLISKLKVLVVPQRPKAAQFVHYCSQVSYVLILMYYIRASKYWDWYLGSIATAYLLNFLGYKYILKKDKFFLTIIPLVITTSVFIFITGYTFWTYVAAVAIAILSRFFIRLSDDRPVFNPSVLAIVAMTCLGEGNYVTPSIALVDKQIWIPIIVILGILTTFVSNRIIASLSYWFGFIAFTYIFHLLGVPYIILQTGTVLGFFFLIFTFHVLTDPQTTPDSSRDLFIFGLALALLDTILRSFHIVVSSFVALNILSASYACYRVRDTSFYKKLVIFSLPLAMVILGIQYGYFPTPKTDPMKYGAYQLKSSSEAKVKPPFFYEEKSRQLNLYIEHPYSPKAGFDIQVKKTRLKGMYIDNPYADQIDPHIVKKALFNSIPSPVYAVGDFDNDGFYDLMTSGYLSNIAFHLFKNIKGDHFEEYTAKAGINLEIASTITNATFIDFDNDGLDDIFGVLKTKPEKFVLLKNTGHSFTDVTRQMGLDRVNNTGRSSSIELLDYDLDGYLDIIVANYPLVEEIPDTYVFSKDFKFAPNQQRNILLKNVLGKRFENVTNQMNFSNNEFTHDIGVADLNNDGYPDLYFSNDYGRDKVFYNQHGKNFKEVTDEVLGHIFNRNGMGVDFTDIEGTGFQSIYVSNISAGRFRHGMNYFWNNINGHHFENKSNDYDIGRCGYSWTPKFYDPDLDGNTDLIVGAGYKSGVNNAWYEVNSWGSMPNFLKSKKIIADNFPTNLEIGGHQRKCLFWKKDNKYYDVAEEAGITDLYSNRTFTLLDMKNDANPIIISGNFRKPRLQAYQNIKPTSNHWVGLFLIGTTSNRQAIGAKVIYQKDNKNFTRELFPTNGIASLNDRRIIIGLGSQSQIPSIEVAWPSGKRQKLEQLKINSYNNVFEK